MRPQRLQNGGAIPGGGRREQTGIGHFTATQTLPCGNENTNSPARDSQSAPNHRSNSKRGRRDERRAPDRNTRSTSASLTSALANALRSAEIDPKHSPHGITYGVERRLRGPG